MKGEPTTFWAKLERNEDGDTLEWHPLMDHSVDVAIVLRLLLQHSILNRRLATLLGWDELDTVHIDRLCVLAAIHDAGKVNNGFQALKDPNPRLRAGHVAPIISLLDWDEGAGLLEALGIREMVEWFSNDARIPDYIEALCATWAHHGKPVTPPSVSHDRRLWESLHANDPRDGLRLFSAATRQWFPAAFEIEAAPFPTSPAFLHAFNGVLTLADWLGSNQTFFPYAEQDENRLETAERRAEDLLVKMHLDPRESRGALGERDISFEDVAGFPPYEIQEACMSLPISETGNLTILESDTGSGKTEAALARFIRLFQAGEVDGMYFAVPTRSAATQLHERIESSLRRLFPDENERPPCVLAVPGYIRVDKLEGDPNALPGFDVQWPDDAPTAAERGWAAESSKRYLAGATAVGTVDQVLMSALQVKHAHMRAAALCRQFLVVDEVHSSDPYMARIMEKVLDHHLAAGGHALMMSATLGTTDRLTYTRGSRAERLDVDSAVDEPYPLITHTDGKRAEETSLHARSSDYEKRVLVDTHPIAGEPDSIAKRALDYADQGARVLVIRNLVRDCVATQEELEHRAGSESQRLLNVRDVVVPHHSRYSAYDRRKLDEAVEEAFGKNTSQASLVAVATQTVEQSLDIDADILLTDLCPADVLLQRIGRLHRHGDRERPGGFETARVEVLVPESHAMDEYIVDGGDMGGSGLKGPHGLGTVYQDLRVLEATWNCLESDNEWVIPKDNRRLVESTTHPEKLRQLTATLGGAWEDHEAYVDGTDRGKRVHSDLVTIDRSKPFSDSGFTSDIERIKTRLGNDDWSVTFEAGVPGPLDTDVFELTIPDHWMPNSFEADDDTIEPDDVVVRDGELEFTLGSVAFQYDRLGLRRVDESNQDGEQI